MAVDIDINRFVKCLEELRKIDADMPIQRATVFAYIVLHEGCTVKQLCDWSGINQSVMSRHVRAMSKEDRHGNPGYDVIKIELDSADPRRTVHFMTAKGRSVARTLTYYLSGQCT